MLGPSPGHLGAQPGREKQPVGSGRRCEQVWLSTLSSLEHPFSEAEGPRVGAGVLGLSYRGKMALSFRSGLETRKAVSKEKRAPPTDHPRALCEAQGGQQARGPHPRLPFLKALAHRGRQCSAPDPGPMALGPRRRCQALSFLAFFFFLKEGGDYCHKVLILANFLLTYFFSLHLIKAVRRS